MANGAAFAIVHNRCEKKYDPKLAGVPREMSYDEVKRRGLPIVYEGKGKTLNEVKKAKYVVREFEKTAVQERLSSLTSGMHVCEIEGDDAHALGVLGARLADEKDLMGHPGGDNQFRRSLVLSEDFPLGVFPPEGRARRPGPEHARSLAHRSSRGRARSDGAGRSSGARRLAAAPVAAPERTSERARGASFRANAIARRQIMLTSY